MLLKSLPKVFGWTALIVWLSFIYLFLQYDATRPTVPQPAQGRVYSSNNHGHVVYLNTREEDSLHSLQIGAFSLFVIAALMDYFRRNPQKIGEIHSTAIRTVYGLFSPASWWAFAVMVRRRAASIRIRSVVTILFGCKRIRLHSTQSLSDCRTRLDGSVGFNTVGPVLGSITGDGFHLFVVRKGFRNSFAPHFYGKLIPAAFGTVIEGKFRMQLFIRVFLTIWFTGLIGIGGRITIFSIQHHLPGQSLAETYRGVFFPGVLLLCGVFMVYWLKVLGADDEEEVASFLRRTLNAQS